MTIKSRFRTFAFKAFKVIYEFCSLILAALSLTDICYSLQLNSMSAKPGPILLYVVYCPRHFVIKQGIIL